MATNTTNYGWTKPSYEDAADIEVINGTIDDIDEQVKTIETNILSLTPTTQYIRYTSTAANTYEDSGLSLVVPAGKICLYWVEVKYNASKPYGIVVALGSPSTPNLIINKLESTEGLGALTITGIQLANSTTQDTTYNIFVKYADANKGNDVLLAYIII